MNPRRGRPPGATGEPHVTILVRVRPDQRSALAERAEEERKRRGGRRLDLSRVLRAILDKVFGLRPPPRP